MNKNITAKRAAMGTTTHNHKEHTTANAPFHSAFFESLHKEQWKEVRLGEMIKTNCKSIDKNYPYNIVQYLDTGSITDNRIESLQTFDLKDLPSRAKRLVQDNDIIYSLVRPIQRHFGFIKNPSKNLVVSTGFCTITTHQNILDSKFLYYFLTLNKTIEFLDLIAEASTSAYPAIKPSDIENLTIPLPPLETQQRIAEILSSLDDKIDLLHRQNKTLESLSLTLFRHTFIDNPKRNEWEEVTLNDICLKIASGGTPSTRIKEYYSGKINWYSTKELDDNFLFDSIQTITEDGLENSSAKLFPKDTIIIAIYAAPTVGRLGILTQDSAFNQAACGLIIDETKCSKEFVFCFLKNERENLNLLASGSAQQNLNVEKIKRYTLLLPDKTTLNDFQIQAKGFFDKIYNNSKQIQKLESLRDIMLPKLLSGEMEV
ncbi:restriction endonuclease subunit S [uncultured Helicobacter sp.]|uniref:restriction endonuclease subunit S n=1 Tax=uncultured Helicobacter sp. TaxID=175537 RepID=UPI002614C78B|nr:restriction endonuclease subunit S [uncultured Helicobacter sp.]